MRPHRVAHVLLLTALLCLSAPLGASGQQQAGWTWRDRDGNVKSRADLDKILEQHKLWLNSNGKSGARADLFNADLSWADLNGAYLSGAYLRGAHLTDADLTDAHLADAELTDADLKGAHLTDAQLGGADLHGADLNGAYLSGAYLSGADLKGAHLSGADLKGVYLGDAHLDGARLDGAHLTDADLFIAHLSDTVFEPKNLPPPEGIAWADGLQLMTYYSNPGPLTQLRKQFQDAGYREAERAITCALNRREADLDSPLERWFKRLAFDFTCQYGFTPGRPLLILLVLWLILSGVYAAFIYWPGPSGIYFIANREWSGKTKIRRRRIRPRAIPAAKWWKLPLLWLRREWRVLRAALFFSLLSAFDIGFHEFTFGSWLRKVTKREYDLKAVGWARTVAGIQSLLSVYLIALWVLSYFGRPFG